MMFTSIRSTPKATNAPPDPAQQVRDLLLGCHDRIRYFLAIAEKLSRVNGAPEADIASAVEKVLRYFTVALPLHEADENVSLHPRLLASHAGPRVLVATDTMVAEHRAINETLQQLLPLWKRLQKEPSQLATLSKKLAPLTRQLSQRFDAHLKLEEEIVFPALDQVLSAPQLAEIAAEMKQRRTT